MRGRSHRLLTLVAVIVALVSIVHAQEPITSYEEQIARAQQLLERHEYFDALKAFYQANQIAGGKSAESFLGMAEATDGMRIHSNALQLCDSAIEAAADDALMVARARRLKGQILRDNGAMREAEAEFRLAIAADPVSTTGPLHFELALTLLEQHRDDDAAAELRTELELHPDGPTADRARDLIEHPGNARRVPAPAFSLRTRAGQELSLEGLRGRTVLLDFWATWCATCVRAVPSIRKLLLQHAADGLVVISIGGDADEPDWNRFVDKNAMAWPQYLDKDRRLRRLFNVAFLPTYILIGPDGVERMRVTGSALNEAPALSAEIEREFSAADQPHP